MDWANVAIVVATEAAKVAKGEDWKKTFTTRGLNEYELYQQAKQRHNQLEEERAAVAIKKRAQEAERLAVSTTGSH